MAKQKKILIAEDEGTVILGMREALENLGYEVVGEADTRHEAIWMAKELSPDLVLMDIVVPDDMDAIDAAERIYTLYDIPVLYLASLSDEEIFNRALKANNFGCLIKPFNNRELYSSIEMTLHKHSIIKKVEPEESVDSKMNYTSDAVITTDSKGLITKINPAAVSLTGWTGKETVGSDIFAVFELDKSKITGLMDSVRSNAFDNRSLLSWVDGLKLKKRSGESLPLSINIGFIKGNNWTNDEFFFVLIPDGAEEINIRENPLENYYRIILDTIDDSVFLINSEMKIVVYNKAFVRLCKDLGLKLNDLDKPVYQILYNDIFGTSWDYKEIFKTGAATKKERSFKKDGYTRYISLESIPFLDADVVTDVAVIGFDITREKEIEERDKMIAKNFKAHNKNVEDIADLCGLLKDPVGEIKKLVAGDESQNSRAVLQAASEISSILEKMDMKWVKYEKIKNYFDVMSGSLPENNNENK
ncbi:MAG: response regulator [Methanomicrobiaceae archaeon]|nr:response regulator [Methanomicrobiaceae archaeon]